MTNFMTVVTTRPTISGTFKPDLAGPFVVEVGVVVVNFSGRQNQLMAHLP